MAVDPMFLRDLDSSPRPAAAAGRLYDPKRDPLPVVPAASLSTSTTSVSQSVASLGDARNSNNRMNHNQKQQRLYDPNQAQSNRHERQSSGAAAASLSTKSTSARGVPSSSGIVPVSAPATPSVSTAPPMPDGLVRLTKEIQALEKKAMEKPLRRSLDSDNDDADYTRRGGNTWSKRIDDSKRLASKYLKLMQLDFKSSLKHDIDTRCWKLAFYPLIESFRAALRDSEGSNYSFSGSDDDESETIRHYFTQFIATAQEFYVTLMTSLQALEAKHGPVATAPGAAIRGMQPPRWHRCVGIMGDLARYRWLHKLNDEDETQPSTDWLVAARRLYREAIDLGPGNGKMYNQLALLAGGRGLESLYYYSKSLTVKSSFMNARDTLRSFFGANEQIRTLEAMTLRQNAKARHAALANTTVQDCEASFLLLQAMLFEKVNLDLFEKRLRMFLKQVKSLHQRRPQQDQNHVTQPEQWDSFYFMMAVINLAGVYEFNWSSSVIAKSTVAFCDLADDLMSVTTLPYSARLLLTTMEQSMLRYLSSVGEDQKVHSTTLEEQQGWLAYCHVVLIWMAGKPFGSSGDMLSNWLVLANQETMPTFWMTLTKFMNHHWDTLTPFEQSDMLSALSDEVSERQLEQEPTSQNLFKLSSPPLAQEWEIRGLAWMPTARFGSKMFKGVTPLLDESELKGDSLWKPELAPKRAQISKRIVELSLVAALDMGVVEFDFCENAFKVNDEYAVQVQETMSSKSGLPLLVIDDYSTDDAMMSSSHASISQEESGFEDDGVYSDELEMGRLGESNTAILELKSKRDQLKMMLSGSNTRQPGREEQPRGQRRPGRQRGGRGFMDQRRHQQDQSVSNRRVQVPENSILVIDTNCIVADWTVVQRLVSVDRWTVIIPLAVITELDGLKNNPAPLGPAAADALTYLEGCLAQRPRMRRLKVQTSRGNYMNDLSFRVESFNYDQQPQQSQKYYSSHRRSGSTGGDGNGFLSSEWEDDGDEEIIRNHNVDDFILGLCLWHQEHPTSSSGLGSPSSFAATGVPSTSVIYLVTDDRNLRVKARARSVEVLSKDDIVWMTSNSTPSSASSQLPQHQPLRIIVGHAGIGKRQLATHIRNELSPATMVAPSTNNDTTNDVSRNHKELGQATTVSNTNVRFRTAETLPSDEKKKKGIVEYRSTEISRLPVLRTFDDDEDDLETTTTTTAKAKAKTLSALMEDSDSTTITPRSVDSIARYDLIVFMVSLINRDSWEDLTSVNRYAFNREDITRHLNTVYDIPVLWTNLNHVSDARATSASIIRMLELTGYRYRRRDGDKPTANISAAAATTTVAAGAALAPVGEAAFIRSLSTSSSRRTTSFEFMKTIERYNVSSTTLSPPILLHGMNT
ncbi:hypothetical protein BG004_006241 [Podila humilis]|nr:hypothetical protein BG004_006241 [Podila humilis]